MLDNKNIPNSLRQVSLDNGMRTAIDTYDNFICNMKNIDYVSIYLSMYLYAYTHNSNGNFIPNAYNTISINFF